MIRAEMSKYNQLTEKLKNLCKLLTNLNSCQNPWSRCR